MICLICFDEMAKVREYDLTAKMMYTWAVCNDCRREVCVSSRPLAEKDEIRMMKLYYEGNTEKELLVW